MRAILVTRAHEPFGLPGKAAGLGSSKLINIEDGAGSVLGQLR